ncbi:MAG TPA: Ig-like domain-containing protein [Chloroflexia bacterium]|nr:Ig-like domain-containing protein [Chloroflexia bacterium]
MSEDTTATPAGSPPRRSSPPWTGLILVAGLVAVLVLGISALTASGGQSGPPPGTPTATIAGPTAAPPTVPPPTTTPPAPPPPDASTATPLAGAATFTPEPRQVIHGPHVLGITAGVGMRAGDIAGLAPIAVTFSEAMDHPSAQTAFVLQPAAPGDFTWQTNTLVFTPHAPLAPSTTYSVTVGSGAKTQGGQGLAAPLAVQFKTAAPPAILRTLPSAGAAEVPTDTIITISFNRPMIPLTALDHQPDAGQWVSIQPAVAGRWVWLGTAAAGFHAATGFLPATEYAVTANAGWPDATGIGLRQGTTFRFTTIKPAILSVEPDNGTSLVPLDTAIVVRFNQPMDHDSVQQAFTSHVHDRSAALPGNYAWSPDSTVLTFTPGSLLEFSQTYDVLVAGTVKPATGNAVQLAAHDNSWTFTTTTPTQVQAHSPENSGDQPVPPSTSFGFSFNNPLASGQDIAQYFTVDPAPQGYHNQLTFSGTSAYTEAVQLLPNTTYNFALQAGLRDKWGFPVAPATWQVKIGPLPPSLDLKGGSFQPVYADRPSRVQLETANLSTLTLHLYQIDEGELRGILQNNQLYFPQSNPTPSYPGQLKREWDVPVPASSQGPATLYPTLGLNGAADRLPPGYYFVRATAQTPYSPEPLEGWAILLVGRTGLVSKTEGSDLLIWAADLGSGHPVPNYPLRVELWNNGGLASSQHGHTGDDGVLRLKLDRTSYDRLAIWGEQQDDTSLVLTGWNANIEPAGMGGAQTNGALYTDRPIYRPGQVVYYRGASRLDDDAHYTLPAAGGTVNLSAYTYGREGQTRIYTGTATLSAVGTYNGQFTLPDNAATGSYTLEGSSASASFQVEEYRKPDFQVNVTAGQGSVVHGDPVTATIATSYYFGGPLANVTTTVTLESSPYYFGWSDPDTGESYTFGEGGYPWLVDDVAERMSPFRPPQPAPVQSFQARTGKDGMLTVDVSRYVTTTVGSKSLQIEGQVQDLSNQAVAASTGVVVHQGLYYVGLHLGDYIATAKQPTTITVRTVAADATHLQPNAVVQLRFVRSEWAPPPAGSGNWQLNEVAVDQATVTTDAQGRATYLFTAPSGGEYRVIGESTDARGNLIHSSTELWVASSDPGTVPWRYQNEQQVKLVADKPKYKIGETAHILVTSPFPQATALLTVERGHLKRYRVLTLQGGAPTIDVPLEAGDLPNIYVGLTLLGPQTSVPGAPVDWTNQVTLRQGYVNLPVDTSGEQLHVTLEPVGPGPFAPGSTATMTLHTRDSAGNPAPGELSLAVVDEAIFALAGDNSADLFGTFWSERGLGVATSTSFSSGQQEGRPAGYAGGGMVEPGAIPAPTADKAASASLAAPAAPAAPKKVRTDFRDTAFWQATITTGPDGSATVPVPLPDNLTTWRLTAQGITADTRAGMATLPLTVTQPLLLRPVQPRFLTTGDNPHPQAIIHNNTAGPLQVVASLEVSGALTLDAQPPAAQSITVGAGEQAVVTWSVQVGKGDVANLRYWVHTLDVNNGYLEDAVAAHLPVQPFAAPEAVATSGEVSGTRADESVFLPYSLNPLLGELVVQVSPSLAAATVDSIVYVKEYPYESTDETVSRFLPLVVLEQVYEEQGLKTPYAAELPGLVDRAVTRLTALQQADGGWAWWERGPSNWWETAYTVQGLTAARDAGYAVPPDLLSRGLDRLKAFQQENATPGIDETYHLNMRAYSYYVLLGATGGNDTDGQLQTEAHDLIAQVARLSTHARAWLALGLAKAGQQSDSKTVLDSLAAAARQSSTTAHWEESQPDYWSMGTDTRATALALDALVTLAPSDPLVPKTVRWLMTAEKEGHWLSTQETAISLISLAHYIRQSKELGADYTWQVSAFDKLLGEGVANRATLTGTTTLRLPVAGMPQNTLGDLALARDGTKGKMYYQVSLRYYVPGEGIKARSEGLSITRTYYRMTGGSSGTASAEPIKETAAGDLIKVRLTIVAPETSYYVLVTDPLPAGLEGINGSLNTTSFTERPTNPSGFQQGDAEGNHYGIYDEWYYRWGPFDNVEMRDDRTVLFATYMSPGTYVYEYYARATTPGVYLALPAHAELLYYPDVFGHSDGGAFTVK